MTFDPFGDFAICAVVQAPGLDGSAKSAEINEVLGNVDEPPVKAQYEAMLTQRKSG